MYLEDPSSWNQSPTDPDPSLSISTEGQLRKLKQLLPHEDY
jgi:hypothetical protein